MYKQPSIQFLALILMLAFLTGCSIEGRGTTRWFGHSKSYDLQGEKVFLDAKKLPDAPDTNRVNDLINENEASQDFVGIDAAIGLAIDVIEEQLRKEAARYVQQFSRSKYHNGGDVDVIEIIRTTSAKPRQNDPASRAVFALIPIDDKSRMFKVVLTQVTINTSRAKVSFLADKIDVDYAMSIEGTWTTKDGHLDKHVLMSGGGVGIRGYDLSKSETVEPMTVAGYVYIPDEANVDDLALKISLVVSERDASKAAKTFTSAADLLKENRDKISGALVDDSSSK